MPTRPAALLCALLLVLIPALAGCGEKRAADPVAIRVTLADGSVTPSGEAVKVAVGAPVTITVTSDRDDEVHVHGYDLEIPVTPGATAERTFTADQPGRWEVETHHPAQVVVFLDVS